MKATHRFKSEDDISQGGTWFGERGEKICDWEWNPATRTISLVAGHRNHEKDLSTFGEEWLTDQELRRHLPPVAIAFAEEILGKRYET
jgi:hypothetical protein